VEPPEKVDHRITTMEMQKCGHAVAFCWGIMSL
jgi:hypothetical protein